MALTSGWGAPESPLEAVLLNLWLEFDAVSAATDMPIPNVFLGTTEPVGAKRAQCLGILLNALEELGSYRLPSHTRNRARECVLALPPGAGLFQAGLMVARRPTLLRLCLTGLDADHVAPLLADIGWPGPHGAVKEAVAELRELVDRMDVDLNLIEGDIGSALGLELSFVPKRPPEREPRWFALLDWLVHRGLCTPEKRDALVDVPGHSYVVARGDSVSTDAGATPRVQAVIRGLNHVKLTVGAGGSCEAKAYVSFRQCTWDLR